MSAWRPDQSLNDWLRMMRAIYGNRNSERDQFKVLAHLCEVVAGLNKSVRKGNNPKDVENFLAKTFAWYVALASSIAFRDLEATIWQKYPAACPYCLRPSCACARDSPQPLDSVALRKLHMDQPDSHRPRRLSEWQDMFRGIYGTPTRLLDLPKRGPSNVRGAMLVGVARLFEEVGELAEAIRLEHIFPVAVRTELADVFAWIMALANLMPEFTQDPASSFEQVLWARYPGQCTVCFREQCQCLNVRVRASLVASAGADPSEIADQLTGLQRKEAFERDLALAVANTVEREPLSLLFFDLDHFKRVNDAHGHEFGDVVLCEAATIFRRVIANYGGSGYRWGGEEFAALLPNRAKSEATACAERLRSELEQHAIRTPQGSSHRQSASIGVSTFHGALGVPVAVVARALFSSADQAVYAAKEAGRNTVIATTLGMDTFGGRD